MKLLIGGSPCTHWSIAQTKNRRILSDRFVFHHRHSGCIVVNELRATIIAEAFTDIAHLAADDCNQFLFAFEDQLKSHKLH